jgi:hypothetical protein
MCCNHDFHDFSSSKSTYIYIYSTKDAKEKSNLSIFFNNSSFLRDCAFILFVSALLQVVSEFLRIACYDLNKFEDIFQREGAKIYVKRIVGK